MPAILLFWLCWNRQKFCTHWPIFRFTKPIAHAPAFSGSSSRMNFSADARKSRNGGRRGYRFVTLSNQACHRRPDTGQPSKRSRFVYWRCSGVRKALQPKTILFHWMRIDTTQLPFVQSMSSDLSVPIKLAKFGLFIYSKLEPKINKIYRNEYISGKPRVCYELVYWRVFFTYFSQCVLLLIISWYYCISRTLCMTYFV